MPLKQQSLYATFGTSSTGGQNNDNNRVELTAGARLRDWTARSNTDEDDDARSQYGSEISKEDADVTTALIFTEGGPLGEPEPKRGRFWFSPPGGKGEETDLDAIATQRSVFDDPDLAGQYQPQPDWYAVSARLHILVFGLVLTVIIGKTSIASTRQQDGHGARSEH